MRPNVPLRVKLVGPGIVFRPALPHIPDAGCANAAVLNNAPSTSIGSTVASARTVLLTAVPPTCERLPPNVAVKGFPDLRLRSPPKVQSFNIAPFHPFNSVPPVTPIPLLYWKPTERLW